MAEVPAAIPADVLEAARPVVHAAAEAPAAGVAEAPAAGGGGGNPTLPAEEVSWFYFVFTLLSKLVFRRAHCLVFFWRVALLVSFHVNIACHLAFWTLDVF